jgi:hypothetical protein
MGEICQEKERWILAGCIHLEIWPPEGGDLRGLRKIYHILSMEWIHRPRPRRSLLQLRYSRIEVLLHIQQDDLNTLFSSCINVSEDRIQHLDIIGLRG